jgi:hypothetical protein
MHACVARGNHLAAKLVIGFGLIVLGLIFVLRNFGAYPPAEALRFWPLALFLLALASFARRGFLAFGGHLFLLAAIALQLKSMGYVELMARWWPLGLIWLGGLKVARSLLSRRYRVSCQDSGERFS